MKIVCTGGGGFIGTNLRHEMEKNTGSCFVSIDSNQGSVSESEVVKNLNDMSVQDLKEIFVGADAVVHLAAGSNVIESQANPSMIVATNVEATVRVAIAATTAKVPKFIFTSTCGAIAGNCKDVITEQVSPNPLSLYGASKLAAEVFLRSIFLTTQTNAYILRLSNVYGPMSFKKNNLIPNIARQLTANGKSQPILIRGDGTAVRDFVYVRDVCSAISQILLIPLQSAGGELQTFNISAGYSMSVNQIIEMMGSIAGQSVIVEDSPARQEEAIAVRTSPSKAERELNWTASTKMEDGLSATIKSFLSLTEPGF